MKGNFQRFGLVVLIGLTASCALIGGARGGNTGQNQPQPAEPAVANAGEAKGETSVLPPRVGTSFRGSVGDAKVEMDIKRDGGALSGSYYYLK